MMMNNMTKNNYNDMIFMMSLILVNCWIVVVLLHNANRVVVDVLHNAICVVVDVLHKANDVVGDDDVLHKANYDDVVVGRFTLVLGKRCCWGLMPI